MSAQNILKYRLIRYISCYQTTQNPQIFYFTRNKLHILYASTLPYLNHPLISSINLPTIVENKFYICNSHSLVDLKCKFDHFEH